MKKLTAGIFTALLGLVTVNAADAAVASKGYVIQEVKKVTDTIGTVAEGKTVVGLIEEAKSAASTDASDALKEYSEATDKAIADMDAAYKAADEAINQTITTNKNATDAELAKKEDIANKVSEITLENKKDGTKYTSVKAVAEYVDGEIEAISGGVSQDLAKVGQDIQNLDAAYKQADTNIGTRIDGVEAAYKQADADAKAAYEAADAALGTKIDGVETAYKAADTALGNRVTTLETDNTQNKTDIATLQGDVAKLNGTGDGSVAKQIETVTAKINTVETQYKEADQTLTQSIASTQAEVDALEGVVAKNATDASAAATTAETNAKAYALAKANAAMDASVKYTDDVVSGLKLADIARVPAACSNAANYCALTTNGTNFIWEVIERASGETIDDTPVTVPATVAATKPTALTE